MEATEVIESAEDFRVTSLTIDAAAFCERAAIYELQGRSKKWSKALSLEFLTALAIKKFHEIWVGEAKAKNALSVQGLEKILEYAKLQVLTNSRKVIDKKGRRYLRKVLGGFTDEILSTARDANAQQVSVSSLKQKFFGGEPRFDDKKMPRCLVAEDDKSIVVWNFRLDIPLEDGKAWPSHVLGVAADAFEAEKIYGKLCNWIVVCYASRVIKRIELTEEIKVKVSELATRLKSEAAFNMLPKPTDDGLCPSCVYRKNCLGGASGITASKDPSSSDGLEGLQNTEKVEVNIAGPDDLPSEISKGIFPELNAPQAICNNDPSILGFTTDGSGCKDFVAVLNGPYRDDPEVEGRWGYGTVYGVQFLGYFTNISVNNSELSMFTYEGKKSIDPLTRGYLGHREAIQELDLKMSKFFVKNVKCKDRIDYALGNAPPCATEIRVVNSEVFDSFYAEGIKHPVRFSEMPGSDWKPPFDVQKLATHHYYILAETRAGKGYLNNAILVSAVGKPIITGNNREKLLGILYIDFSGQLACDSYGFFKELSPDPRIIVDGRNLGISNSEEMVELIFRTYHLENLSTHKDKFAKIRRTLEGKLTLKTSYSSFHQILEEAIETAYTSGEHMKEKMLEHIEVEGGEKKWQETIVPAISEGAKSLQIIDKCLEDGKLVVIDLAEIEPKYRPGIVYRLLRHVLTNARECYNKNGREEYAYGVLTVIDEAHNFVPERGFEKPFPYVEDCKSIIESIATEASKYGLGLGLLTQRYAWTSKNVLANMLTYFIGRVEITELNRVQELLGGEDPRKISAHEFLSVGVGAPFQQIKIRSLSPRELAKIVNDIGTNETDRGS